MKLARLLRRYSKQEGIIFFQTGEQLDTANLDDIVGKISDYANRLFEEVSLKSMPRFNSNEILFRDPIDFPLYMDIFFYHDPKTGGTHFFAFISKIDTPNLKVMIHSETIAKFKN